MAKDFLVDDTGDLIIENGRFKVGESTAQEAKAILLSNKGDWKNSPLTGVEMVKYLNGPFNINRRNQLSRNISLQMELDGLRVLQLKVSSPTDIQLTVDRP